MTGLWIFLFKRAKKPDDDSPPRPPIDLVKYQAFLLDLKKTYESKFDAENVTWCDVDALPPEDNIFARFKFSCERHAGWNEPDHPSFTIYWTVDPDKDRNTIFGSLHDRCGIVNGEELFEIQRDIVDAFPDYFDLYREWNKIKVYDSKRSDKMRMWDSHVLDDDNEYGAHGTFYGGAYDCPCYDKSLPWDFPACRMEDCDHCMFKIT